MQQSNGGLGDIWNALLGGLQQEANFNASPQLGRHPNQNYQSMMVNQLQTQMLDSLQNYNLMGSAPYQQPYLHQSFFQGAPSLEDTYKKVLQKCAGPFCPNTEGFFEHEALGQWFCCNTCEIWFDYFPDWKDFKYEKS